MAGILYVVGIGPGEEAQMTPQADEAVRQSQVLAGYTVYVDLLRERYPDKEVLTTAMTQEEKRCRLAFECCAGGRSTAMVCSGDAGVYGMAGLILELAQEYPGVAVEIVPGITAACAGAAILGAPLMHDFAVISLSDRLTALELIWKRVELAAQGDFVICLYNPASRTRKDYLARACRLIGQYRSPETVCGLVRQIGREGQEHRILTLKELENWPADMFTTVFIGNSSTKKIGSFMVTPRGYHCE